MFSCEMLLEVGSPPLRRQYQNPRRVGPVVIEAMLVWEPAVGTATCTGVRSGKEKGGTAEGATTWIGPCPDVLMAAIFVCAIGIGDVLTLRCAMELETCDRERAAVSGTKEDQPRTIMVTTRTANLSMIERSIYIFQREERESQFHRTLGEASQRRERERGERSVLPTLRVPPLASSRSHPLTLH